MRACVRACVCVCERARVCVCACVRASVCVREREGECVGVGGGIYLQVCVCVFACTSTRVELTGACQLTTLTRPESSYTLSIQTQKTYHTEERVSPFS